MWKLQDAFDTCQSASIYHRRTRLPPRQCIFNVRIHTRSCSFSQRKKNLRHWYSECTGKLSKFVPGKLSQCQHKKKIIIYHVRKFNKKSSQPNKTVKNLYGINNQIMWINTSCNLEIRKSISLAIYWCMTICMRNKIK